MTTELPESACFALLANRDRRHTLRILQHASGPLTVTEIATRIADRSPHPPADETRRRLRIALHHEHVPRLEDAGVLAYDREAGSVELRPNFERVVYYLERMDEDDSVWFDGGGESLWSDV